MPVNRRSALFFLTGLPVAGALSACGFHLRGSQNEADLPFKSVHLAFGKTSALGAELRRYVRSVGTKVVDEPKEAEAIVALLSDTQNEAVLSLNSQGRIRELVLNYSITFRVHDNAGKELLVPTTLAAKRDLSFNEAVVLAKEAEKAMLYRDMQSELVQQILRRLAAIKPS